jgi:ecotin
VKNLALPALLLATALPFLTASRAEESAPVGPKLDAGAVKYLNHPNLYPKAKDGEVRQHFIPPIRPNEENYKIEIAASKVMEADSANRQRMAGAFEEINIEGWGFTYYKLKADESKVMSTLIGGGHPVKKPVPVGQNLHIRYNSKLPVVVIAPKGYDIQYRVWSAPEKFESMQAE